MAVQQCCFCFFTLSAHSFHLSCNHRFCLCRAIMILLYFSIIYHILILFCQFCLKNILLRLVGNYVQHTHRILYLNRGLTVYNLSQPSIEFLMILLIYCMGLIFSFFVILYPQSYILFFEENLNYYLCYFLHTDYFLLRSL